MSDMASNNSSQFVMHLIMSLVLGFHFRLLVVCYLLALCPHVRLWIHLPLSSSLGRFTPWILFSATGAAAEPAVGGTWPGSGTKGVFVAAAFAAAEVGIL